MSTIRGKGYNPRGKRINDVTVGDIAAGNSIAIGRGYEDVVTRRLPARPAYRLPVEPTPNVNDLHERIAHSALPPIQKENGEKLLQTILAELNKGDDANILTIHWTLDKLKTLVPDLCPPLCSYIENATDVPVPVKILTRNVLNRR